MAYHLSLRNGTAATWTSTNPVLALGEPGIEDDTGKIKFGDGATAWNSLAYAASAGPAQTLILESYGDGSDGNVTISSGTTNLTRDMYYNNLTINGTGVLNPSGYRVFVLNNLDLTAAPVGAINENGTAGGNASGATGGSTGAVPTIGSVGIGQQGGGGATGTSGAGTQGVLPANFTGNGGAGGGSGTSGAGTNAGVAAGAANVATAADFRRWTTNFIRGITLLNGGGGGHGGASGGGDGTNSGGGGGAGGNGGGILILYAKNIIKSSATPAGVIESNGGAGGNAGTVSAGVTGGGAGGAGGGGGWVYIAYQTLAGPPIAAAIQANSGPGGAGGNGFGGNGTTTGVGGQGGAAGAGGRITLIQSTTDISQEINMVGVVSISGVAFGATGGGGGISVMCQATL